LSRNGVQGGPFAGVYQRLHHNFFQQAQRVHEAQLTQQQSVEQSSSNPLDPQRHRRHIQSIHCPLWRDGWVGAVSVGALLLVLGLVGSPLRHLRMSREG